jgi:prepilin peptidase CpaA
VPGRTDASLGIILTCLVAVVTDLKSRKIPNWLTFASLASALLIAPVLHGWMELPTSMLGTLAGLAVFLPFFIAGWLGAGDVKLLAALGAWGGAWFAADTAVHSILIGGVLGVVALLVRGTLLDFFRRFWQFLRSIVYRELEREQFKVDTGSQLPFAIPMALAAMGRLTGILPGVREWLVR